MNIVGKGPIAFEASEKDPVIGDSLAIAFAPRVPADGVTKLHRWFWNIAVTAVTRQGVEIRVGDVHVPHYGVNDNGVIRVVAGAYCPGADAWRVYFSSYAYGLSQEPKPPPFPTIDAYLSVSRTSSESADRAFAWSVGGDGLDLRDAPEDYPLAQVPGFPADVSVGNGLIIPHPLWLARHKVTYDSGTLPRVYMQLFDTAVPPTPGDLPLDIIALDRGQTSKEKPNLPMYEGYALMPSSTPGLYTPDPTAITINVVRQRQRKVVP